MIKPKSFIPFTKLGALILGGLIGVLVLLEMLYFRHILRLRHSLVKADAIVVFQGENDRIDNGYVLANSGLADYLIVSPATDEILQENEKKHSFENGIEYIIESRARTTFENALHTKNLIIEHRLTSIILVTTFDHMPRSYFLLRMLLLGSGIRIQVYKTGETFAESSTWMRPAGKKKRIYNEMLKLWGSIGEYAHYQIHGKLPETPLGSSNAVRFLKSILLFY